MRHAKIDDFKVPLELLGNHTNVIERWQLEAPVNELITRLLESFGPRNLPPPPPPPDE
jgi:hypothetical protein